MVVWKNKLNFNGFYNINMCKKWYFNCPVIYKIRVLNELHSILFFKDQWPVECIPQYFFEKKKLRNKNPRKDYYIWDNEDGMFKSEDLHMQTAQIWIQAQELESFRHILFNYRTHWANTHQSSYLQSQLAVNYSKKTASNRD